MVAVAKRAFLFVLLYSASQYIEAQNNLHDAFCFIFIPLSPCPPLLRQWLMYPERKCWNSGSFIEGSLYDVFGTSMISAHLHCSWLLHFVKSLHLLCTNSGMFFYQGIHMCVSVCLCVVFISPVSSVEVVRAKRAYCCVYLKNWIHSLHTVLLVFCTHIKSKRLSENFFSVEIKQWTRKHWKKCTCQVNWEVQLCLTSYVLLMLNFKALLYNMQIDGNKAAKQFGCHM